ncbi:T7SS effector LXG polymorphic toxin, partial [Streptococcus dentapri]
NLAKGNYGEIVQDEYYRQFGYERISKDMVTSLDSPGHQGIDGVYYNPDGHPPYIISEAKYNTARLNTKILTDGSQQMNSRWIDNRLREAVGRNRAMEIIRQRALGNVQSNLFNVKENGNIIINQLDNAAKKMK